LVFYGDFINNDAIPILEMATCLALHNWNGQSGTFLGTTKGRILRINLINGDRGNISSDYILDQGFYDNFT
jgi:hypothetical protein